FKARTRKASSDAQRQRAALWGSGGFLLLAMLGIPWPELKHGRPLARTQLFEQEGAAEVEAPESYRSRCAACHGAQGRGDGLAASAMQPKPRDFAERSWQRAVTDDALRAVIAQGGLSRNLSASMPPHPDLRAEQLEELVRFIRRVPALATPGK
ncbi:MAG TPA: cytochrome c, partial [Polyangiales bacterium]